MLVLVGTNYLVHAKYQKKKNVILMRWFFRCACIKLIETLRIQVSLAMAWAVT